MWMCNIKHVSKKVGYENIACLRFLICVLDLIPPWIENISTNMYRERCNNILLKTNRISKTKSKMKIFAVKMVVWLGFFFFFQKSIADNLNHFWYLMLFWKHHLTFYFDFHHFKLSVHKQLDIHLDYIFLLFMFFLPFYYKQLIILCV